MCSLRGKCERERLFYIGTQWELCWAVWDGLNWTEVHYKCLQTMSMCTLEECGLLCLSMGRDVFQVGCKECTGRWEWVSFVCVCICICMCVSSSDLFLSSRSMGGIFIEYCFLSSEVPWKAMETMWDGNYISCGQREKSQPHFHLLTLMTENQCNTYSKEFHSKNDSWYNWWNVG